MEYIIEKNIIKNNEEIDINYKINSILEKLKNYQSDLEMKNYILERLNEYKDGKIEFILLDNDKYYDFLKIVDKLYYFPQKYGKLTLFTLEEDELIRKIFLWK